MVFTRVDEALTVCATHLDSTGSRNTEVESFLVNYLLSIIYAEYEQEIRQRVAARLGKDGDLSIRAFTLWASKRLIRSIMISDLKGILGRFSEDAKQQFAAMVDDRPPASAYNNILVNRHSVAHERGSNMTFAELEDAYFSSQDVLTAFSDALHVSAAPNVEPSTADIGVRER